MARLTPQQVIDREMEKLKSMGITMNVQLAPSGESPRVMSVLKEAAKGHGIHYGEPDDEVPHLDEGKNQSFPHAALSEQTTALIAELRRAADKKRADLALQSAALFTRAADALEAATPRVVSTVAQLDALPVGSIVMDRFGSAFQNFDAGSWWMGAGDELSSPQSAVIPATVLWVGGTE